MNDNLRKTLSILDNYKRKKKKSKKNKNKLNKENSLQKSDFKDINPNEKNEENINNDSDNKKSIKKNRKKISSFETPYKINDNQDKNTNDSSINLIKGNAFANGPRKKLSLVNLKKGKNEEKEKSEKKNVKKK